MSVKISRELRELMREYTPRLLPVALAFADEETEAEDILQNVWIDVSKNLTMRPPDAPMGAWLYKITLNEGRSLRRKQKRREAILSGVFGWWNRERDDTRSPSLEVEQSKLRMWQAIADLPALQREVLLLRVVDERSTSEVAQILDRAEGTVKASLHRALSRLRKTMGDRHDLRFR